MSFRWKGYCITEQALARFITSGKAHSFSGVPKDAKLVRTNVEREGYEVRILSFHLIFEHESFPESEEGDIIPTGGYLDVTEHEVGVLVP